MLVHHFYPKTSNIGDHFVQRGVERLFRSLVPDSRFELFNVNARGDQKGSFGLTHLAVSRANREADLVLIGGSNLYEGRNSWGVHMELGAIDKLKVPLILLGIGTGSNFLSQPPHPSDRVRREIKALNDRAVFSGVRDIITLGWLNSLGITKAELAGDPATFIFNRPFRHSNRNGHILVVMPSTRYLVKNLRDFWDTRMRAQFPVLVSVAQRLVEGRHKIIVACNDPADEQPAHLYFGKHFPVIYSKSPDEYFQVLKESRAVVSGRLHTAVVAFSLGIPFVLIDVDERTRGFVKTYSLDNWSVKPCWRGFEKKLQEAVSRLFDCDALSEWEFLINKRNLMHERALHFIGKSLAPIGRERS